MEDWIAENRDIGGPSGTLETSNFLVNEMRALAQQANANQQNLEKFRAFAFDFIKEEDMVEEWDKFVKEKENAVQEQQTEEVPLQEEAESGEETVEAPEEESTETKD